MSAIAIHKDEKKLYQTWIKFLEEFGRSYKLVDCYSSNIMKELEGTDGLIWNWFHHDEKAILFAKQLIYSLEYQDYNVFPDSKTIWHYDDKVGQKFLLESIGAPFIPTHVFFKKGEALDWARHTSFPKVFKLRRGASSMNVMLVHSQGEALKLIKKAFGKGFNVTNKVNLFKDSYKKFINKPTPQNTLGLLKRIGRFIKPSEFEKTLGKEKGYIYFQDYLPNNDHDTRIVVVGDKAFGIKRMTRENDFRASGSGNFIFDPNEIENHAVKLAFELCDRLDGQMVAFDFLRDKDNQYKLTEISYTITFRAYDKCPGYWSKDLTWHDKKWTKNKFYP